MKPVAFALGRSSFCEPTPFQRERSVHATVRAVAKKKCSNDNVTPGLSCITSI